MPLQPGTYCIALNALSDTSLPVTVSVSAYANTSTGVAFTDALLGRVPDAVWRSDIADRLATRFGPAARPVVEEWTSTPAVVDRTVLALLRRQRRTAPGLRQPGLLRHLRHGDANRRVHPGRVRHRNVGAEDLRQ